MKSGLFCLITLASLTSLHLPCMASSDGIERRLLAHEPDPELTQMGATIGTAYLHPWNDTRINLLLLLQDQGRLSQQKVVPQGDDDDLAPIDLGQYTDQTPVEEQVKTDVQSQLQRLKIPTDAVGQVFSRLNHWPDGRCISDSWSSLHQFLNQLELAGLTEEELHILALARVKIAGTCPETELEPLESGLTSPSAREFALYLKASAAFYAGNFLEAAEGFKLLAEVKTAWIQETAFYMLGRVYLNLAQQGAADSWGLFAKDAINSAQLANASQAFSAYVKKYPEGIYSASAKGLARKIAWLGQNQVDLPVLYGAPFKATLLDPKTNTPLTLLHEIDNRYWFHAADPAKPAAIFTGEPNWQIPDFAAVAILARQRITTSNDDNKKTTAAYAIAPEAIKSTVVEFKKTGQEKLGQYLLLSHQFFVLRNYPAVVEATATQEITEKLNNVDFSFLYLRGLALEKTQQKDKAYSLWKALASKTKTPGMRIQSQIAFMTHLAENDKLQEAFAENSLINFAPIRKPAIIHSANARALEYIMQAKHSSPAEKHEALSQLVRKNLHHQQYAEALRIIKLYPLENYNLSDIYSEDHAESPSATPLIENLQQYVDNPKNSLALANLASRYANFHLTDFTYYTPGTGQVGGYEAKWTGEAMSPLKIFQQVMQEPGADEEAKAKAISGAINCFKRTGANRCDNQAITPAQRKTWFATLKKTYGKSEWAQVQKLYW